MSGVQEIIPEENKIAIKNLTEAGIKIWVLSSDNEENTISCLINAQMLKL